MHSSLRKLFKQIGEDPDRSGLKGTPRRFGEAMEELTSGYKESLEKIAGGALFPANRQDLVIVKDIAFSSLCEHHLLPFCGRMHIGYIPDAHIIGLSKIPRIVAMFACRLQVQERLGQEIADALQTILRPKGVGVVIEAEHFCMSMRGKEKGRATVTTHYFLGTMKSDVRLWKKLLRFAGG